ncbi:hypothetical protein F4778DRAFT_194515 [Xylariomycetidae sp. FL2044]|nr:hypothetical protein F4778DRAFT_194515 [Xylariomycetidae sp. FL2044]
MSTYYPMTSATQNPRKRPAPGALPMTHPMSQPYSNPEQQLRWNGHSAGNFADNSPSSVNPFGMMASPTQTQFTPSPATPSTALARRGMSNALVTAPRAFTTQSNEAWPTYSEENLMTNTPNGVIDEHDNIEILEERAQRAKRDAQAKRKQIPPFVQKLNSFLEESKNTDLIRWSDKGDSFIVLDEDEFAKTLIPELFKHNNYASFVRQLNMYGFHKKVGLSDNSMKASERKNKSPSEYYNPYFKRGHPNLLWLINKPKTGNKQKGTKKRGDEIDGESDEEVVQPDDSIHLPFSQPSLPTRALPAPESGPLQRKELAIVRDQMTALQQRQKQISDAITRLRQEHNQMLQQAIMFQNQHERHENSINAILNFLANVFRKSLEEQGGAQNVNDLLASIIVNVQMPQQGQGSVVDLGDWVQQQAPAAAAPPGGTPKRAPRLLPPIPADKANRPSSATAPPNHYPNFPSHQQPHVGQVTEVFDTPTMETVSTPAYLKQELESNPQEGMMRIIQDANTNAGNTSMNLPNVAANTSTHLTNEQRNRMLNIMSQKSASPTPVPATSPISMASNRPAATNSSPVNGGVPGTSAPSSLSPIMSSIQPPSIQRMSQNHDELEQLQRLQSEQAQKLEDLNHLLGPLSPSGRIPGLDDTNGYFDSDIDLNQYLEPNAYTADGTGHDFNFDTSGFTDNANFDWNPDTVDYGSAGGALDMTIGRVAETNTPVHKSPSPSGTEEILRDDMGNSPGRATKRQRQS